MLARTNIGRAIVAFAALVATWTILGTAVAQRQAVPKAQDKLALGENEVKPLLLLMDTDENGKISKQEWMKFMEAEFDRLDKDKKGQLDCHGTRAIEVACKPPRQCGEVNATCYCGR
jgi:hypothetical protein